MKTIFCIRPKGFNVGNDAIFLGMQHFLYAAFGQVVNLISIPATSRYESHAKAGLTAKTIYEINQYGHGVIVGGGNLYENGELEVDTDALSALEVPLMLFSLSKGRIYNRWHKLVDRTDAMPDRIIRALNEKASYSLVRDEATGERLHQLGCENVQVGGCPTIFLDRMARRLPTLSPHDQGSILLSVRNPALMNIPLQKQSQVYNDILDIISFLKGVTKKEVRLLCHDYRDIAFAASIPGVEYVYTGDVYTYLALLRDCALNISYRLHATLPCFAFGTPSIKITYDERALSLMNTVGLGDWNINMIHTDRVVEAVADRFEVLGSLEILRSRIQPSWQRLYGVMLDNFRHFAAEVEAYGTTNLQQPEQHVIHV